MSLQSVVEAYRSLLTPNASLEALTGARLSPLDILGALRLALVLRQIKDTLYHNVPAHRHPERESHSFAKDLSVTLIVVYGGEMFMAPWLGLPPSFLTSSVVPLMFIAAHLVVHLLPSVPPMCLELELPFALLDGMTRTMLLIELIPAMLLNSGHPPINASPFGLVVGSLFMANGGFFFVNLFSMLSPHGFALSTPAELQTYGWTTLDLWIAPLTTAAYAFLTQPPSQPFWRSANARVAEWINVAPLNDTFRPLGKPDHELIRAAFAVVLATCFSIRAFKNFGPEFQRRTSGAVSKKKQPVVASKRKH